MDRDDICNMGLDALEAFDSELAEACMRALSGGLIELRVLENLLLEREIEEND